ncbi:MAG: threonine/serine dehydratase [Thermomicrobium sp.]|nr:threonine/serine dehydratase [Thermomicrobium sp.]MDW8058852.1 threonine/serine dehydratase [Thermomicrobium sp.]
MVWGDTTGFDEGVSVRGVGDGHRLEPPTFQEILRARAVVQRYLAPTPLVPAPPLSERLGCEVYLKCEQLQPIGAFKVRGGIYLMSKLSPEERARGVVTASTGNHGQSIAYAARLFGVRAIVYAPEGANPLKVAAMRRLGAEVVLTGRDFDEARLACEARAAAEGLRYVHSANEPDLIAGVGTYALEIVESLPDVEAVIVPIGAGSGVCGTGIVMKTVNPVIQVIGVQAAGMPVVYESWRRGQLLELVHGHTFAEGIATRVAFELPLRIIRECVDEIVLVSDEELACAMVELLESRVVAEGAGAAALAAAYRLRDRLAGKKVVLVVSGGNVTLDTLRWAFTVYDASGRATEVSR